MRIAAAVTATVAFAAAAAACSSGPAPYAAVPQVHGVRTADAGRTVLLTYSGGGCDAPAKTRVALTASVVTVTASIGSTGHTGGCTLETIPRVLAFHLSSPLGSREVRNGLHGRPVPAFDGAVLTNPRWLPAGYVERTDFQTPDVAGSWSRTWVYPNNSFGDHLTITQSPHHLPSLTGVAVPGRHTVNGSPATVTQDRSRTSLSVQWNPAGAAGSARVSDLYDSRPTLTVAELLHIAASLPTGS